MRTHKLTDRQIQHLQSQPKQYEVWDSMLPAFGIRISPSGTKSFQLLYRYGGRPRRLSLGRYPTLSLSEARRKAQMALREVAMGRDPGLEKSKRTRSPQRFGDFVALFVDRYAKAKNRRWQETQRLLQREFVSVWGKRDLREIAKSDVLDVLDRIVSRGAPITANRAFAAVRRLFNWAVERGVIEASPCTGLRAPALNRSRDRVLNDGELARIWSAAEIMGYPFGRVVQLLILTAQRLNEVTTMQWHDLDLAGGMWSLPSERNKSRRAHEVPLTPAVIDLIRSVPLTSSNLLFPGARGGERSISGISKWKRKLDDLSGVRDWTLHDLRRSAATGMAGLKVRPHVVERILNHTSGTFAGVAGVYNRFGYIDEMRDALGRWADHLGQQRD